MINRPAYQKLKEELAPRGVKIIAISKRQPKEKINALYDEGHRDFGENLAQALTGRKESFADKDINWHFVGHLQSNKAKYLAPFVSMIHSVDSLKVLKEINKQARKNERTIDCLMQVHIADEETKFGLDPDECKAILDDERFQGFDNVRICGLMGMATLTENVQKIRDEFKSLRHLFEKLKTSHFNNSPHFKELSMGMTSDYKIAVDEGSTMVRIGTMIFGPRVQK